MKFLSPIFDDYLLRYPNDLDVLGAMVFALGMKEAEEMVKSCNEKGLRIRAVVKEGICDGITFKMVKPRNK